MFFKSNILTAIDIGFSSVKIAKFKKKKDKLVLLELGSNKVSPGSFKEGDIEDQALVATTLERTFKDLNIKPEKVVTTISNDNIIIRNIEMPAMPEKELAEALKWEIEDYLPFPAHQAALDYLIIEKGEEIIKLLLVAAHNNTLNSFMDVYERAGVKPLVINVQPMALLSILQYQNKLDETAVIVDIGASGTRVVIGDSRNVYLSRTIDTGGYDFTKSIMESRDMEFMEAEKYKIENGLESDNKQSNQLDTPLSQLSMTGLSEGDVLSTLAANLGKEISRSLEYYQMKFRGSNLKQIYLTGGGSRLKGLTGVINEEIELEIVPLNPFGEIEHDFPDEELVRAEFSIPIGLAVSEVVASES